jgi:uncharacterized protein YdeI (YjbR/CyaY-like superfamily)
MPTIDKRVDAYIDRAAEFAIPILLTLRQAVHKACPDVVETIKWGFPNFDYKGSILCSMAAFKNHCAFGYWLASMMEDPDKIFEKGADKNAMGFLGQLKSVKDLPSQKILVKYTKQAMALMDKGVKLSKKPAAAKKDLVVPEDLIKALKQNKDALNTFNNFSYSGKKEYVEWITEAKTEATREKRMDQAVEWMAEGKIRHWKYNQKNNVR